ncbi:MAG: prepilin-type N-terminal cleavage/methylation domain-containing protein [Heliobacteriaceae bacterium]|nr:prepilin-type N-terminal cleavage/methylation domain-containing protein [Heliobacteriaceae bacterium]
MVQERKQKEVDYEKYCYYWILPGGGRPLLGSGKGFGVCHCEENRRFDEAIQKSGSYCKRLDCFALRARNDVRGFTLAEVLITLGIIGVVAALTMPALIAEHKKKVFITKSRYMYSLLSQATVSVIAEHGDISGWDFGATGGVGPTPELTRNFVYKYYAPYINYVKDGIKNGVYYMELKNGIHLAWQLDWQSGANATNVYMVPSFDGTVEDLLGPHRDYSHKDIVLTIGHGMPLRFFSWVNMNDRAGMINESNYGCNKTQPVNRRLHCGALLQYDGWEIKNDYPW